MLPEYTRSSCYLRRIGGRGHFRSRDKDVGQTIRPAMPNTSCYRQTARLSLIEPELLPIEVLHCGNREYHVFMRKLVENIIFLFALHKERT